MNSQVLQPQRSSLRNGTSCRGRGLMAAVAMHTAGSTANRASSPARNNSTAKKQLNGNCVIRIAAVKRFDTPIQAVPNAPLPSYMKEASRTFEGIQMPMGGALQAVDADKGLFEITVPRIQLFDLWLLPKARANVRVEERAGNNTRVVIGSQDCTLHGSQHVEQFKLNDRFNLDVAISFAAPHTNVPKIVTDGRIEVQIDIPPPFSFMPKPVLESAGNTALQGTLSILLSTVVASLASDYKRWASTRAAKGLPAASPSPQ